MSFQNEFPPIENSMEMEPEELAPFVLKYLSTRERTGKMNRYNFTLSSDSELVNYAGGYLEEFLKRLTEAWIWLEREIFIAPRPGDTSGNWKFITRKGKRILESQDFNTYQKSYLLPSESLDPILARKVKPAFIRGDYDTAIFQAFKEIEVRVRTKAGYENNRIGVKLMRDAFSPKNGPLTDNEADEGEKVATMELFAGAVGKFKNPSSHRDVEYTDPNEVADIIRFANHLLRMVDNIK
jgi:uncharacterized protein (TIGR02391 family)